MVVIVFRSRLVEGDDSEFQQTAARMIALAEQMPGFVSYKVFKADDGERCSLIEFDTHDNLATWRNQAEHAAAQTAGRDRFYQDCSLQITDLVRESRFER